MAQERYDLGHGKDAKTHDHQFQAVCEVGDVIGRHPQGAARISLADGADEQAKPRGRQTFKRYAPRQHRHHRQAEDRDHQHLGQAERQDDGPRNNDEQRQESRADQTAEER